MKKIVAYILIFLSLTAFNIKADVCGGYELRLRDSFKNETVIKCYTDYNEAKTEMYNYKTDEKNVTVIYKNDKLINAKYAFANLDGFSKTLTSDGYGGLTYVYENANDYKNGKYRYTYISGDWGGDAAFIDYDETYDMVKIKISGVIGYVRSKYVKIVPIVDLYENTVSPKIDVLTLRGGPSSTSPSYGNAPRGTYKYTDVIDDGTYKWYKIDYNGTTRYLAQNKEETYLSVKSQINIRTYYKTDNKYFYHTYRTYGTSTITINLSYYSAVKNILEKNQKYYSFDGNYFYKTIYDLLEDYRNNNNEKAVNKNNPYFSYYQYLPMHSITGYTADDFNRIVASNGYTRLPDPNVKYVDDNGNFIAGIDRKGISTLYNKGESFINVANSYGVNAFSIFVTAMLEGGMGTSELAIAKNNPFGHNAYDSCVFTCATSYKDLEEAIANHAKNYVSAYGIPTYAYYMGAFLGNKGSGMNVNYASDPYWGEKQARLAYYNDDNYGGLDYNKNTIGIKLTNEGVSVYKEPNKESTVIYKLQNEKYKYKTANMSLIVTEEVKDQKGNLWYKVYTEVALTEDRVVSPNKNEYLFDNSYGYVLARDFYVENNKPEIEGIESKTVYLNDVFDILKNVKAIDKEDGDITDQLIVDGNVDTSKAGEYIITYKVTDSSRFTNIKQIKITVVGDSIPVINANDVTISQGKSFIALDYVNAYDSVDGNINSNIKVILNEVDVNTVGTYKVTYEVINSKGIKVAKTINVTVVKDLEPKLYVASLKTKVGNPIDIKKYVKAIDNEDGNIVDKIKIDGNIDYNKEGIYEITISVEDTFGHKVSKSTKVYVKEYTKKDGAFYLEQMNYNAKTGSLDVSGYLAIIGIDNVGELEYNLIFKDKNSTNEYAFDLKQFISNSYSRTYKDNKNKYDNIWFKDSINLKDLPRGEYVIYISARKDNYECVNLFRNMFLLDITKKAYDDEGRGYYFRNNNYEREFPLELIIRENGLIASGDTKHSSNMYNSISKIDFVNTLNITGYSFNINGDYKNEVNRYLVLENIDTEKRYTYEIGSIKGSQIKLNVDDGYSRIYAWFTASIDLTDLEKGRYVFYVRTKSLNGIDDYGELKDVFLKELPSKFKIKDKEYTLSYNKNNWFRLELLVS